MQILVMNVPQEESAQEDTYVHVSFFSVVAMFVKLNMRNFHLKEAIGLLCLRDRSSEPDPDMEFTDTSSTQLSADASNYADNVHGFH